MSLCPPPLVLSFDLLSLQWSKYILDLQVRAEEHARLERSLWNDTAFLSQLGVMDYSLLVGVDKSSNVLVVGIIDFIRQVHPFSVTSTVFYHNLPSM